MSDSTNVNVNVSEKETQVKDPTVAKVNDTETQSSPGGAPGSTADGADEPKIDLLTVEVNDDNTALNVIVGFLGIAQRRGVFAINESAKIYECIQQFQKADK